MRRVQADLAITAAVAVLAVVATAVGAPIVITAVLGIALLAAPGYVLGQLLFGSHISGLERIAVATGLALCVPVLGGLLIVAAGLPLDRTTWLGLLAGVTLVSDVILLWRRRRRGLHRTQSGQRWEGWRLQPRKTSAFGCRCADCGLRAGARPCRRRGAALPGLYPAVAGPPEQERSSGEPRRRQPRG